MAVLDIHAVVGGVDYGDLGDGSDTGQDHIREVTFGAAASDRGHFDIRNLTVGTSGYGSSEIWAPPLLSPAEFDGIFDGGGGGILTVSGGLLSVDVDSGDLYGWKDLGADYTDLYVQFDLFRRAIDGDGDPDYHDFGLAGVGAGDGPFTDGIFRTSFGGVAWRFDGPGFDFGTGPPDEAWITVGLRWTYPTLTGFSLAVAPSTITIPVGGSGTATVTSTLLSPPDDTATLSATGQPAGATVTFAPSTVNEDGGTAIVTVTVDLTVAVGSYSITIHGIDGGGNTANVDLALDVVEPSIPIHVKERVPFN